MEKPEVVSVVGDGFCVPYPLELIVKRRYKGLLDVSYQAVDANGSLYLQVDGTLKKLQKRGVVRDHAGFPILTLREKALTARQKWTVHGGQSSEESDLLFSSQRSKFLQMKTRLDVFLASNLNQDAPNFHVVGSYVSHSFKVYKGDILLAEVKHGFTWASFWKGKDNLKMKVYPGVDYAFIVALTVIFIENDLSS